ncbi:MAG: bi-domain-containing oxidoreductase [Acetobacteraceae bacterium]|nr:bi-domain-containing oxidoreductase [Acetobacteraceae bacterium]
MRALLHSLGSGEASLIEAPAPLPGPGEILVRAAASVVSPGTERMLVEFGRAPLWRKALQQPERVRQVLDRARAEGLSSALDSVRARLSAPLAPGYAAAGRVLEVGAGVTGFAPGDRVAAAGPHAELFVVPATLAAQIPDNVPDEAAAFASIGAIALQAVRLCEAGPGSAVGVTGLGLVGLLAVQGLRAAGCRVFGLDLDGGRVAMAQAFGAEAHVVAANADPALAADAFSRGRGLDAVIVATAGGGAAPLASACRMARPKGRIVLLGTAEIAVPRALMYAKELSLVVSSSYGPGRHDPGYLAGQDWPVAALRWTAGRNMEAFLDLLAMGAIDPARLVQQRVPFERAAEAYAQLDRRTLGLVLTHAPAAEAAPPHRVAIARAGAAPAPAAGTGLAVIGAGNFAQRSLIPSLLAAGAAPRVIVSAKGVSAASAARKFGFALAASEAEAAFDDPAVAIVAIATPHQAHAALAARALAAGKHVWVEKPLSLDDAGIDAIEAALGEAPAARLVVGFNRRFAPDTLAALAALRDVPAPRAISIEVAAPALPAGHWLKDRAIGGGPLLGEGCHFIDLACCLAEALPVRIAGTPTQDGGAVALEFPGGSTASIHYFSGAHRSIAKERIAVSAGGRSLVIENFRRLRAFGVPGLRTRLLPRARPDKGHAALARAFVAACRDGGPPPIAHATLLATARAILRAASGGAG